MLARSAIGLGFSLRNFRPHAVLCGHRVDTYEGEAAMIRRAAGRRLAAIALGGVALVLSACAAPFESAGTTARIEFVSTSTSGGWKFDYYRNLGYPCSIAGYQAFVVGTKVGSSATATRPLWVRMRGGGVGYFSADGQPQPSAGNKSQETAATLIGFVQPSALTGRVRSDPAGFRLVSVSMCNHDLYAGGDQPDPNNPNRQPDGKPRTTNGLFATKAAIQFVRSQYPTGKTFLHGTSAGSAGAYGVAWSLEKQGLPPAGVVADSGIVNLEASQAKAESGICIEGGRDPEAVEAIKARSHPTLATIDNEPDKVVARGGLTVPLMHVWNQGDDNSCGDAQLSCPLRDGTSQMLGATDCTNEPMRAAIAAQGAGSRSRSLRLCVSPADEPGSCSVHVVTNKEFVNTDPGAPADYNAAIIDWVHSRLGDP
ncbi:MAG: hypothetical protein H0U84_09335 [Thermoleophilaceae bacterium]|nr:hypothetical protein [Thermoleophilaceae bacterium]